MQSTLNFIDALMRPIMLKDRIREAMEGAGLKPLQLARLTGKTSGAVTQWIDGTTKALKAETAARIENATGYSATWLVTGEGPKKRGLPEPKRTISLEDLTPGAVELGHLYDMVPVEDRVMRARAFSAASSAIVEVLAALAPNAASSQRREK